MKHPIKIIHKYKNNNRRIQYNIYIYIGKVPSAIMDVLNYIVNKDFYTVMANIKKTDYKELEEYYGKYWYNYFFTSYHINAQKKNIINTKSKINILLDKYKKEWYNEHIEIEYIKNSPYSFASEYYDLLLSKNKIKNVNRKSEIDYRTYNKTNDDIINQDGGNDTDSEDEEIEEDEIETDNDEIANEEIVNETVDEDIENELDLNDIEKLYQTVDIESQKSNDDTTKLISEAIHNKSWVTNTTKELEYNDKYDSLVYDSNIEDIHDKIYINEQYIYNDDSIKTIKNKICMSIPFSDKMIKILPECMYMWSEYNYNNKKEYIMLGQKWVTRTELLKIDIKPNENSKTYEKLRNNLSYLKDNIGHKIKREDDEEKVLNFYDNYMTMNEIFMLDIYNEIGNNYNIPAEDKKNFFTVYVNIYYPLISFERFDQITDFMNGQKTKEINFIDIMSKTIMNDNKLLTEIENTVERIKNKSQSYKKLFAENYIIQSTIHVNLQDPKNITGTNLDTKFNLYRIFDNFIVTNKYPFIQYQTPDSQIVYKIYNELDDTRHDLYKKWFENAPYGLSFKIDISENKSTNKEKYLSITLHETGRIEYKITWTEEDSATMDDIKKTYLNVRELLNKINSENKKIKIILPDDDKFKYAFINTIQKFTLPEKFKINHNDLSECCRYLFPYIALVIEPKKRVAKVQSEDITSKYGTYIRYKRISDYDNMRKMQMRILYYLKYFDLSDNELINEISKQFNITNEHTAKEIDNVKKKYGKFIKKNPGMQKKIKSLPRSKPPGIGIDIQGRDRDKYKIRITGARNKEQLDNIIDLMRVLIFLYSEIYLYKNKDYLKLKDTLKLLTNIAKRRNKVAEVVYNDEEVKTVRTITSLDKSRLGFKPEKGQHQWTRSCQNSGKDNKRRPDIIPEDQIDKLLKDGYKMNSKTGFYEKQVELKLQGKMVKTILKAVKLSGDNKANYFTCDPTQNKDHVYIGFLSKSNNPSDLCMPCCFIKDQTRGDNKKKGDYFNKCLGDKPTNDTDTNTQVVKSIGDKIYILQETNKIQDGRYIYLPKYLDIFFNKIWKNDHKIKNHYLLESKSGYFFKFTVKNEKYFFLAAIANIYDIRIEDIKHKMIDFIDRDKNDIYFTYLNNGSIKTLFQTRDNFIKYLKTSQHIEYDISGELIALPSVVSKKGIIYYIINKKTSIEKKILDKDYIKEDYYINCLNSENNNTLNDDMDIVILIKDEKYYFPICFIKKGDTKKTKFIIQKIFENNSSNTIIKSVINELMKYFHISCSNMVMNQLIVNNNLVAKNIINKLNNQKISVFKQYIDERNKCKYLELDNGLFLPIKPSGISYNYPIQNIKNINIKYDLLETIKKLESVEKILSLDYKPKIILHDKKSTNGNIIAIAISLANDLIILVKSTNITEKKIINMGLTTKIYSNTDIIDKEILLNNNDNDEHKNNVRLHNYMNESYNLYRLELSLYLSKNPKIKDHIITLVRSDKINKLDKKIELKKILLSIINKKLSTDYKVSDNMAFITNSIPNIKDYVLHNIRDYCKINTTEKKCSTNLHCLWKNDTCKFQLLDSMAFDFVNKVIEEMIQNSIMFKEIIEEGEYYVSDIIKQDEYTNRNGQKIIKASNYNINKVLTELFDNDIIPTLGKRKIKTIENDNIEDKEMVIIGDKMTQEIIPNADSIIRAYANSYYWVNNKLYDNDSRNLGYISELQTKLTYLLKANIIEYMQNNIININSANENFFNSSLNKFRKLSINTNGMMEFSVLSKIIDIPIIVYDNYYNIKYIYNQGENIFKPEKIDKIDKFEKFISNKNNIFIKFDFDGYTNIPNRISSIYFL